VIAVLTASGTNCSGHVISPVSHSGYISSVITDHSHVGTAECPWLLRAAPGQRISLSLLDFTASTQRTQSSQSAENEALKPSDRCLQLATVRELSDTYVRRDRTVCSVADSPTQTTNVYLSRTSQLEVAIATQHAVNDLPIFLLRYDGMSIMMTS